MNSHIYYKTAGDKDLVMKNRKNNIILRLAKLINVVLISALFYAVWHFYYSKHTVVPYYSKGQLFVLGLFVALYFVLGQLYDAFLVSYYPISQVVYSQALAILISDVFMYIVIWLLAKKMPNLIPGLMTFAVQVFVSAVWAFIVQKWYFSVFKALRTIVIFDERKGLEEIIKAEGYTKKFNVESVLPVEECLSDMNVLSDADTVFLSGVHSHDRNIILKYCIENSIRVMVIPRVGDVIMSSAKRMHLLHLPMLRVERFNPPLETLIIKRIFDIAVSLLALIVLSPIMIITAVLIKSYDHGPVFYKQTRLTKDGKVFDVIKFRSMREDAEKDGVARLSTGTADERITPIGKIIRAVRIDELPQFFNVLSGDMSIVGPRPERPEIAAQYEEEMPEFRLRLQAKAGITGYAQVYGKYNTAPYDKLQMDLMYIANFGLLQDLGILFATVKILFMPESTEGIEEGHITAGDNKSDQ